MENQYDIDVQVETAYVSEHSEPDEDRFVFAYTITLVNRGSFTSQLISRHWFITDEDNLTEEDAFRHEKYMINVIPNLHNLTEGGEGTSGRSMSEEQKNNLSEYWQGRERPDQVLSLLDFI